MLTTLDADTNIDKEYMNIMSYTYLTTPDRKYKSYQPVIFFFNNFRSAPFFSQVISLLNTFWILFNFTKRYGTRNFSTHMQPLDALIELDFWSVQTIVEDGHQYRRSFFGFNGKYECIPVYTKVYQDCNLNTDIFETAKAQYKQMRRWAHGAEDISYVAEQMKDKWKHLPKQRSIFEFIRLLEGTILWSTLHFVLLSGLMFTLIRDVQLSSYLSLGSTISLFTNISLVMMVIVVSLQLFLCPWHQLKFGYKKIRKVVEFIFIFGFLL